MEEGKRVGYNGGITRRRTGTAGRDGGRCRDCRRCKRTWRGKAKGPTSGVGHDQRGGGRKAGAAGALAWPRKGDRRPRAKGGGGGGEECTGWERGRSFEGETCGRSFPPRGEPSEDARVSQSVLEDRLLDGGEDEPDLREGGRRPGQRTARGREGTEGGRRRAKNARCSCRSLASGAGTRSAARGSSA